MKIERHIFESYLAMIGGSVGTNMFRHFYASFDGQKTDTMQDGWTSCAFYVSSVLKIFDTLDKPHSTVGSVIAALEAAGWQKIDAQAPEAGDVLVWEKVKPTPDDAPVDHIGFYIGDQKAISTSWQQKTPIAHDWLFRDHAERQVVAVYRGKQLMPDNIKQVD